MMSDMHVCVSLMWQLDWKKIVCWLNDLILFDTCWVPHRWYCLHYCGRFQIEEKYCQRGTAKSMVSCSGSVVATGRAGQVDAVYVKNQETTMLKITVPSWELTSISRQKATF